MHPPPHPNAGSSSAAVDALDVALLQRAAADVGLGDVLTPAAVASLEHYAAEMVAWNQRVNLTRITAPGEIAVLHFVDSLVCLRGIGAAGAADQPLACVDVGAGAGLPGIVLQLVRPAWHVTLVEAVGKKAAFLAHAVGVLGLDRCTVVHARAEDVAHQPGHRAAYDVAVARAVAALPVLAEYLLPLLRVGGRMLALKGEAVDAEVAALAPALAILGGRLVDVMPYRLPGLERVRHLVIAEKVARTPNPFPRRAGLPAQAPLTAGWRSPATKSARSDRRSSRRPRDGRPASAGKGIDGEPR